MNSLLVCFGCETFLNLDCYLIDFMSDKRVGALIELYKSEITYLKDLDLWINLLRTLLKNRRGKKSTPILSNILVRYTAIFDLHRHILSKLSKKNSEVVGGNITSLKGLKSKNLNTDELEYYSTYTSIFVDIHCYERYIENYPKDEYDIKKLFNIDPEFKSTVLKYFADNEFGLGIEHFLSRPSGKMSRYPSLIAAIAKRENNEKFKEGYLNLKNMFNNFTSKLDKILKERTTYFSTFVLSSRFEFSPTVKNKFSLNLVYKSTKLINSGKLIVKLSKNIPATYKHIFIFNKILLITKCPDNEYENIYIDDDPIFLSEVKLRKKWDSNFAINENMQNLFPLFIIQKKFDEITNSLTSVKAIYFEDENTLNFYYLTLKKAIKRSRTFIKDEFKLEKVEELDKKIVAICKPERSVYSFVMEESKKEDENGSISSSIKDDPSKSNTNNIKSKKEEKSLYESKNDSQKDLSEKNISNLSSIINSFSKNESSLFKSSLLSSTHSSVDLNFYQTEPSSLSNSSMSLLVSSEDLEDSGYISTESNNFTDNSKESMKVFNFKKFGITQDSSESLANSSSSTTIEVEELSNNNVSEASEVTETSKFGYCRGVFKRDNSKVGNLIVHYEISENKTELNRKMLVFSTFDGIYRVINNEKEYNILKISDLSATKIVYDPVLEIIIFLWKKTVYISWFNAETTFLYPQEIDIKVNDFYYGKNKGKTYLALVCNEEGQFSVIHLIDCKFEESELHISMIRKLYVGFQISNISFLERVVIITSQNFQVISMDTLRTDELLEVYDNSISQLLGPKLFYTAKNIFKLEDNTFLLCYDGAGYVIDRHGTYKYSNISYNWEMIGLDFKVYQKWIIVVGECYLKAFEIETGRLVFMKYLPGLGLIHDTVIPMFYKGEVIYKLNLNIEKEEPVMKSVIVEKSSSLDETSIYNWESESIKISNEILYPVKSNLTASYIISIYETSSVELNYESTLADYEDEKPKKDIIEEKNLSNEWSVISLEEIFEKENRSRVDNEDSSICVRRSITQSDNKINHQMTNKISNDNIYKNEIFSNKEFEPHLKNNSKFNEIYSCVEFNSKKIQNIYSLNRKISNKRFLDLRKIKFKELMRFSKNTVQRWKDKIEDGLEGNEIDILENYG